jgi:hypothetical protein
MPTDERESDQPVQKGALALRTLPESGDPPKTRLRNARKAQQDVIALIEASRTRYRRWAMIKGMFQGNPPYDHGRLRANGQAWRFNIATLEGKGLLSAACTPYYDLFASGQHYASILTERGTPDEAAMWSQIITEEFDFMLKQWRSFDYHFWQMIQNFTGYGRGFLMFSGPLNWQFRHIPHEMLLIPDGVPANVDDLTEFAVRERVPSVRLWRLLQNDGGARAAGWNPDVVRRAIRGASPFEPGATSTDPIATQQARNDADSAPNSRTNTVQLAHYFVQEFSGKWTHAILLEEDLDIAQSTRQSANGVREAQFLYKREEAYEDLQQIVSPFLFETLDNSWNGCSGLGKDIFAIMQAKDRLRNSQLDNVMMRQSLLLQAQKASDRQKLQLFNIGPVTVIPENCTPVQSSFIGDIESTLAVNQDLNNMLQMNTGVYRPQMQEKQQGNPETATAATLRFQQATILGGSAVARFYAQLDPVYEEVYRRATSSKVGANLGDWAKMATAFIKRCTDRGVPIEAIRNPKTVRAWRAVGSGSPFLRQQALGMLLPIAPSLPERGRKNLLQDYIASAANWTAVERYYPEPDIAQRPTDQQWIAMQENDTLARNGPDSVIITETQSDVIHAITHLEQGMAPAFAALEQGADPVTILSALEGIGPHAGKHIQRLAQDSIREGDYKALLATWKEYAKATDKIAQHVQQQQESGEGQQQQGQVDPELQKLMAELELKKQELMMKLEIEKAKLQMDKERFQAELQFKREEHQLDMRFKQEEHKQDMQIKDATASAQIRTQTMLAGAKADSMQQGGGDRE